MRTQMWLCNAMPTVGYVSDLSGMAARPPVLNDSSERGLAKSKANKIGSREKEAQKRENDRTESNRLRAEAVELIIKLWMAKKREDAMRELLRHREADCREDHCQRMI